MGVETTSSPEEWRDLAPEIAQFRARLDRLRRDPARPTETLWAELETAHEELRVAEEELRVQQEELDQLTDVYRTERWLHERLIAILPAAVVVTDGQGIIRTVNAAAAGLLRIRVDRLVRKPLFSYVEATDRSDLRQRLSRAVATGEGFHTTATVRPRSAEPFDVQLAATLSRDERSGTTQVTWVCLRGDGTVERAEDEQRLAQCLVELTRQAVDTSDTGTVLSRLARMCQRALSIQTWVSITVGSPTEPELVATDSRTAQAMDGAQMTAGEGPCSTAWEAGVTVTSDDVRADPRWPRLARRLDESRVNAVVAVPLAMGESTLGALNVYSDDPSLTDVSRVRSVELLGAVVAAMLQETDAKAELAAMAEGLREAMQSRAAIEQAKGMLMAMHGCSADDAFHMLLETSSRTNVKVRVLASRLVEEAAAKHASPDHGPRPEVSGD